MGCKSTNERYKEQLIRISKKPEQEMKYLIEQIIINTNFYEKDIYFLFEKFNKLDPNSQGLISNTQLLELPEFKYCPFKKHLIRAFNLEAKNEEKKIDLDEEGSEADEENNGNDDNSGSINEQKQKSYSKNTNNDRINKNNNFIGSSDKFERSGIRKHSYIQVPIKIGRQYIDFKKFCEIMKVFHYKCEIDTKIKFYFDLFDFDGDGRISKNDLKSFFNVINTKDENDATKVSEANLDVDIENYIDPMIQKISQELITDSNRQFIDNREFRSLMWNSNIDKTCVIYLEEE